MDKKRALEVLDQIPTIGEQVDALEMAIDALTAHTKAKWIETIDSIGGNLTGYGFECPCCRLDIPYKTKFCPNCGADMRGAE